MNVGLLYRALESDRFSFTRVGKSAIEEKVNEWGSEFQAHRSDLYMSYVNYIWHSIKVLNMHLKGKHWL